MINYKEYIASNRSGAQVYLERMSREKRKANRMRKLLVVLGLNLLTLVVTSIFNILK